MYEELVKELRAGVDWATEDGGIPIGLIYRLTQAADAIEELSAHYCKHMVRNVHDRGDDSLCRVLKAEPPKPKPR